MMEYKETECNVCKTKDKTLFFYPKTAEYYCKEHLDRVMLGK